MKKLTEWIKILLCRTILMRAHARQEIVYPGLCDHVIRRSSLDWLYYALSTFTYVYLFLIAAVFIGRADIESTIVEILDALQEPYLGALGIYTVLKEIRKRRRGYQGRYWGELFVIFWLALLGVATALVLFFPGYESNYLYAFIVSTSLVVVLIYLASVIHKP